MVLIRRLLKSKADLIKAERVTVEEGSPLRVECYANPRANVQAFDDEFLPAIQWKPATISQENARREGFELRTG
jgi:hypothetical protein